MSAIFLSLIFSRISTRVGLTVFIFVLMVCNASASFGTLILLGIRITPVTLVVCIAFALMSLLNTFILTQEFDSMTWEYFENPKNLPKVFKKTIQKAGFSTCMSSAISFAVFLVCQMSDIPLIRETCQYG